MTRAAVHKPVTTTWIHLASAAGAEFSGYLALPPAGQGPGLVLFQEIFGVNAHMREVADQYAADGFVVLAPDLFWRQQHRVALGYEGADRERALELMRGLQADELQADVRTCVAALRARPELAANPRVGCVGYCLGGRLAYIAAAVAGADVAVAYYGGGIQDRLELAPHVGCAMQFHYAEHDHGIALSAVESVRAAMAGQKADFFIYPGAQHGFNCADRSAYHARSAALAHGRTLAFLAQNLF